MLRRGQLTTLQERLLISEYATQGLTDAQIATQLGCSRWTVRKWRRAAQHLGRAALTVLRGRPRRGPLTTFAPDLGAALVQLRRAHPGWGPVTLLAALPADPYWPHQRLPSRARVAALLQQRHLTRRYQPHADLPQPSAAAPALPHIEWPMDAQAATQITGLGRVSLINLVDVTSRVKVERCPRVDCYKPATDDYYLALRRAFIPDGLPWRLSLDHDTVFFDNTTPSPFPTRLHLWLIGLGIEVVFTRKRCPTDHAVIERTHQTLFAHAIAGQTWSSAEPLWRGLDERRAVLNEVLPVRTLVNQAPLRAYPEARATGRPYRPEWEEELLQRERVDAYLAQGRWFRPVHSGVFHLGAQRYYIGRQIDRQTVELHYEAAARSLVCHPAGVSEPIVTPVQGLSKADLMGELAELGHLPTYQLALPWERNAVRRNEVVSWGAA